MKTKIVLAASALIAGAVPAMAHPGHDGGMLAGLAHPLTGMDHMAAMVAVGLFAATRPARAAWAAPGAFMAALAAGAGVGLTLGAVPGTEAMIAASLAVLGALVLLALRVRSGVALGLIAASGALHGIAHGAEATGPVAPYVAGFLIASALLHGAGWQLGRMLFAMRHARVATGVALTVAGGVMGLGLLAA
ncbi:HupE/UreJ family protein [Novosphingobium ovatum]|nr:HupE/UreJ family protein [Novosphingobium ovatum]